jgi:hypothetical protein
MKYNDEKILRHLLLSQKFRRFAKTLWDTALLTHTKKVGL